MTPESTDLTTKPSLTTIFAYSRRQAMDWSLVLISQGIETTLEQEPGTRAWLLRVPCGDHSRALASIHQYRLENQGWNWRGHLPGGDLRLNPSVLIWCVALASWHYLASTKWALLTSVGRMDSAAVSQGQWWRLFTAVTLHSDLAHLMANVTFGLLMLGFAMGRFGTGPALLATFCAGALGNVTGLLLYSHAYFGVGASGMMMGALGVLGLHSLVVWRESGKAWRYVMSGVMAGFFLFILFGLDPSSDVLAHLGGFIAGVLFGGLLSLFPKKLLEHYVTQVVATLVFLGLLALVWTLALRS
ncbi:MAG: rhomboid family intramembrane serine protease [Pedosphaera sp.]|nr:rhomboid family intramembrane serine protease [Pedosphaera sp.]